MRLRRVVLGLVAVSVAAGGIWVGSMMAQAQQPPSPYPPYPPPQAYPPPPPPFPFPIPFPDPAARDLLLDGADKLIRALERMIQTLPTYDAPIITPEGDIVIKRRPAPPPPPPLPPKRLPAPGTERTTI